MTNPTDPPTTTQRQPLINTAMSPAKGTEHDVILQTLERWHPHGKSRVFYGTENFIGTEAAWDHTPVIFSKGGDHPDLLEFEKDPQAALKAINGRYAGYVCNSQTHAGPGQPRLTGRMGLDDPEVAALYAAGKLVVSTAAWANIGADGRLDGKVTPNHILVFESTDRAQPQDEGAMLLNSEVKKMTNKVDEAIENIGATLRGLFGGGTDPLANSNNDPQGDPNVTDPTDDKVQLLNSQIEAKDKTIDSQGQEIKDLKEQLKNSNDELQKFRLEQADKEWTQLKNSKIPPGMVKTEDQEKELRALYNSNKDAFYTKLLEVAAKAPAGSQEGNAFMNSEQFEELKEANNAWDRATGTARTIEE